MGTKKTIKQVLGVARKFTVAIPLFILAPVIAVSMTVTAAANDGLLQHPAATGFTSVKSFVPIGRITRRHPRIVHGTHRIRRAKAGLAI